MIISHKYKFIFIKTVKTAGTSIEVYLSDFCGEDDILTPVGPEGSPQIESHVARNYKGIWNPIPELISKKGLKKKAIIKQLIRREKYFNHISANILKKRLSNRIWKRYFKFCVERNPWDKTISHYYWENQGGTYKSFDQYLREGNFCYNYSRYTDVDGNLLVDKVVKYEDLNEELTDIFNKLGVPFDGSLGVNAKASFRKDYRDYKELYNKEQRDIVKFAFSKEIELHGYTF